MTMNEQEAIESIEYLKEQLEDDSPDMFTYTGAEINALNLAVQALTKIQQYRAIGTVEECGAAVEKQTAAKPLGGMDIEGNEYAICRECSAILSDGEWFAQYCPDCGKKVDWREKEQG